MKAAPAIQGRVQPRFTFPGSESPEYQIRRMRFRLQDRIPLREGGDTLFGYQIQLGFSPQDQRVDDDDPSAQVLRDFFFHIGKRSEWMIGLRKLPGNRQRVISSGQLEFSERSIANREFNLDRDTGIFYYGEWDLHPEHVVLRLQGAVTGGQGRDLALFRTSHPAFTLRVEWLPFGLFHAKGDLMEGDLFFEKDVKSAWGMTLHRNPAAQRRQGTIGDLLPEGETVAFDTIIGDLLIKYQGWFLSTEWFHRRVTRSPIPPQDLPSGLGYHVQISYAASSKWGLGLRVSEVHLQEKRSNKEESLCFNRFIRNHTVKIQAELGRQRDIPYFRIQGELGF